MKNLLISTSNLYEATLITFIYLCTYAHYIRYSKSFIKISTTFSRRIKGGKHCHPVTARNNKISLYSKQSSLFYIYAEPSSVKLKGVLVHRHPLLNPFLSPPCYLWVIHNILHLKKFPKKRENNRCCSCLPFFGFQSFKQFREIPIKQI